MPPKENRQTLMFSATFPSEVQQLALGEWKFIRFIWNIYIWLPFFLSIDFLKDYLFLTIGILGSANSDVTQKFVEVCNLLFLDTEFPRKLFLLDIVETSNGCSKFQHFLPNKLNFCCGNYSRKYGTSYDNFNSLLLSLVYYYTFRSKNSRRGIRLLKPSKMLVLIVLWFLLKPKRMPISWHAFCQTKASQPLLFTEIVSNVKGQARHMFSQFLNILKKTPWNFLGFVFLQSRSFLLRTKMPI